MWFLALPTLVLILTQTESTVAQRALYILLARNVQRLGGYTCIMVLWSPSNRNLMFPFTRRANSVGMIVSASLAVRACWCDIGSAWLAVRRCQCGHAGACLAEHWVVRQCYGRAANGACVPSGIAPVPTVNVDNVPHEVNPHLAHPIAAAGNTAALGTQGEESVAADVLARRRALFHVGRHANTATPSTTLGQKARNLSMRQAMGADSADTPTHVATPTGADAEAATRGQGRAESEVHATEGVGETVRETRMACVAPASRAAADAPSDSTSGYLTVSGVRGSSAECGDSDSAAEDVGVGPGRSPGSSRPASEINFLLTVESDDDDASLWMHSLAGPRMHDASAAWDGSTSHSRARVDSDGDDDSDTASVWERTARVSGVVHARNVPVRPRLPAWRTLREHAGGVVDDGAQVAATDAHRTHAPPPVGVVVDARGPSRGGSSGALRGHRRTTRRTSLRRRDKPS